MTTMAAAFRPVIEQVLATREADARKAIGMVKALNSRAANPAGNGTVQARTFVKWHAAAVNAQADVLELRRRAQALTGSRRCHGCRVHGRVGCARCCKAVR